MSGSGFALLIGLLLLGLAVWLLRRANSSSSSFDANPNHSTSLTDDQWGDQHQQSEMDSWLDDDEEPAAPLDSDAAQQSSAEAFEHSDAAETPNAEREYEHPELDNSRADSAPVEEEAEYTETGALGFGGVRRRRRAWATSHGFEYLKEDKNLAAQWPREMLGSSASGSASAVPVASDVVSGFYEGHQTHFSDVAGTTVLAMRRVASSPVSVHYSTAQAMREGMRRIEPLDQPPYVAYTSDVRALDRMLDSRVEDGLRALSQVSAEVMWEGDWLLLHISRKLDVSVWDKILPHVRSLADAAMVLPPESLSIPLEMDLADQTRPNPGGSQTIETHVRAVGDGREEENAADQVAETIGGHLRAVPDADTEEPQVEPVADALADPENEFDADDRPDITRPAEPVVFPSRSTGRSEGDPERFEDFHVADADDADPEGHLPKLGEDPEHIQPSTARRAHVIRSDEEHESTIFDEYSADDETHEEPVTPYVDSVQPAEGVEYAEEEEALSHISRLRRDHRRRSGGGRHRAPDARHARPEPIEAVETEDIETVDGEIVDED